MLDRHRSSGRPFLLVSLVCAVLAGGCGVEEVVMEPFRGETPHERYLEHLERSGLAETALGRDWSRAAREAIRAPAEVAPPAEEAGWLAPDEPTALGYRFDMERGQRLHVELELEEDPATQVFIDVFRVRGDREAPDPELLTVAWSDSLSHEVVYDAAATATFIVRVQPELLRGGPYSLSLDVGPSLSFPVERGDMRDIGSFFGAPRDGGAREHHGLDIFADRGTPVLAAGPGRVRRVQETPRGGKVVWVRNEEGGHSEYYAHLDSQFVSRGQQVRRGDTLGLVGNTGNAVTTPPHLHFGIYSRGPVDPLPFVAPREAEAAPLQVPAELFAERVRVSAEETPVLVGPTEESPPLLVAATGLPLRVVGGSGGWVRVRLPDGRQGFVQPDHVEPEDDQEAWHRAARATLTEDVQAIAGS